MCCSSASKSSTSIAAAVHETGTCLYFRVISLCHSRDNELGVIEKKFATAYLSKVVEKKPFEDGKGLFSIGPVWKTSMFSLFLTGPNLIRLRKWIFSLF